MQVETIGLKVKSWDKSWSGPPTMHTALITGKPCEVQFVNCAPNARVHEEGDLVTMAKVTSKPGTRKWARMRSVSASRSALICSAR